MAAINPNPKYLRELLEVVPDYNRADRYAHFQIIHYAAACEGIQLLILNIKVSS